MGNRSEDWMAEFEHLLPEDKKTRELVLEGYVEICPSCHGLSAYCINDSTGYDVFSDGIVPSSYIPPKGTIAHISNSAGEEWQCGHCKRHIVNADSLLLSPCYIHSED